VKKTIFEYKKFYEHFKMVNEYIMDNSFPAYSITYNLPVFSASPLCNGAGKQGKQAGILSLW